MNISRKFLFGFIILNLLTVPVLVLFVANGLYVEALVNAGIYLFTSYFLHVRYNKKVEPKYPMVPPTLEQDVYFPRTNIPRPIHEDVREHPEYFDEKKKKKEKDY